MAISFPGGSKSNGQKFTHQNKSWTWDGNSWKGGVSSGSDAGTLDSLNSTQFLRSDADDTVTGQITFPGNIGSRPVFSNGILARSDQTDTSGTHDIWGISERYYPSNPTAGDAWGIQWGGSPNEINFIGAGEKKFSVDLDTAGNIYMNTSGGNVGIGTTTPDNTLTVNGGTESIGVQISETARLTLGADGTWNYFKGKSGNGHYFNTTGGGLVVLNNAGNVGMGTSGPNESLHIYRASGDASFKLQSASQTLRIDQNSIRTTTNSPLAMFTNNTSTQGFRIENDGRMIIGQNAGQTNVRLTVAGNVKMGSAATSSWANTINDIGGLDIIVGSGSTGLTVWDDNSQSTPRFKVTRAGNVGIGTSSPGYKLDVQGNFRSTGSIDASNYTGYFMWKGNGTSYDVNNRTTKVPYGTAVYSGYNAGANRPTTYDIALQVSASNRAMEFAADWVSSTAGPLYFRTLRDCCINWSSWSSISMSTVSDRRVKDNIVDYTSSEARTLIEQLQAVEYDYVNHDGTKGNVDLEDPDADLIARPREVGYIAQDVEDVIPYAVDFNPKGDTPNENGWASAYTVNYERLVPVLTEALKDVYSKLDSLQTQLDSANQEIQRLRDG